MDQAVEDSNQPAIGQGLGLTNFKHAAECFTKAFHAGPYVQTLTTFDSGRYLFVNDCFVRTVGYSRAEVIGKTSIELGVLADRADRTWLTQTLRQRGRLTSKKLRFRLRSGQVRIGLFNAEVLKLNGEDLIFSTVADVTEQLAAEQRYRLEHKRLALVEQLAAGLAHEVKNPLAGIKGVADTFLRRRRLTTQEREWMEAVRLGVLKIDAQTRELLDFSRPRVPDIKRCSLNQLVRRVVVLARHHATAIPECRISVELVDASAEPLNVPIDAAQLEDAILNLVLNAIESIEENGRVTVRLSKNPRRDEVLVTVTDTGCGIPAENHQRIFEPFFTTKVYGTGIGLSALQLTIARFGGRISFKTRVGRGSSFEVALPLPANQLDSYAR